MCCWRESFSLISGSTQIISFCNKMELRRIVLTKQSSYWKRQHLTLFCQRCGRLITRLTIKFLAHCKNGSTEHGSRMLMSCAIALRMNGTSISWSRTSLTRQLDSGDRRRLRACIAAGGGDFKHQLWRDIYFVNFSAWWSRTRVSFCKTSVINLKISVMSRDCNCHCIVTVFNFLFSHGYASTQLTCGWKCLYGNLLTF